jgi:hypothetical protein
MAAIAPIIWIFGLLVLVGHAGSFIGNNGTFNVLDESQLPLCVMSHAQR